MAINGSINLLKYLGARKISVSGQKGIFIPVEENPTIFVGTNGAYASIRIVEHESVFEDRTYSHFIAASLTKEKREELEAKYGKDGVKQITPILGNASEYKAEVKYDDVQEDLPEADGIFNG